MAAPSVTALDALYKAVYDRLTESGASWGSRVFPELAKSGTAKPHVIYGYAGGGEVNRVVAPDAEIVLLVKVVALTQSEAFAGAATISARLNDADRSSDNALDAGDDWWVSSTSQEQAMHLVETPSDGVWIYHEGHYFRFRMEAK